MLSGNLTNLIKRAINITDQRDANEIGREENHFPPEEYGVGIPITIRQDEIDAIKRLLTIERDTPDSFDKYPVPVSSVLEDSQMSIREFRSAFIESGDEVEETIQLWETQMRGSEDIVWATPTLSIPFSLYTTECANRDNNGLDDFSASEEVKTIRTVAKRITDATSTNSRGGFVQKKHLPLEEVENRQ